MQPQTTTFEKIPSKVSFRLLQAWALVAALIAPRILHAAVYTKADNTNSLEQAVSWGGTAPGEPDIANWSGTYSADNATTNSLRAVLPGSAISWQGISVGAMSGTALTTNTFGTSAAASFNITSAVEGTNSSSGGVSNIVTLVTTAASGFVAGQPVSISGVTPAGYNGNFTVASVSGTTLTCVNAANIGMGPGTAFGAVTSISGANINTASETNLNGLNIATITTKGNHAFAPGQAVTIAGVTPAGYNGTFVVLGLPSANSFTYSNTVSGLTSATGVGTVESAIYIGGSGAATVGSQLTIETSGIDLSASSHSINLNAAQFAFNGNQTWNLAAGTIVHFGASGTGSANAKAVTSGNDGIINISGSGVVDLNEGGASGFNDAAGFTGFAGKWVVNHGTTLRGIRNGATAFGSSSDPDAITLKGGTLAVGGMSGDVGNWTWNTPITLAPGTTSVIDEQNVGGSGRSLKLNGVITGAGNLIIKDTAFPSSAFTSTDASFILAAANDFSGTLTIGGPVENGIAGRLTLVRVGSIGGLNTGTGPGGDGAVGTGNIVNNGVLTFTLTGGLNVPGQISGSGTMRIGSLASGLVGSAYQTITLSGNNTYTGPTIINAGTLALGPSGTIANSPSITIVTNSVNSGGAINTFDVSALPSGFTAASGQMLNFNGGQINGNVNLSAGSTLNLANGQINGNLSGGIGSLMNLVNSQVYGNLSVASGSTNLIVPGGSNTVGTLTIGGNFVLAGGSSTVVLDISGSGNDQIFVSGNLTASGVTTLQLVLPPTGLTAGTYTLMTASGSMAATPANFSMVGLSNGARSQVFSIVINGNQVQLNVVGSPGNLTWVGDGVNNLWDTGSSANWFNNQTSAKDVFYATDLVNFDDSGSTNPAISLVGSLASGSITMNNSANNYTFGGSGQIVGSGSLTMNGAGKLTLLTSNSFIGGVVLNAGTLAITNGAALGNPTNPTPNSVTLNGGTLLTTNSFVIGANTNRGITLSSGGGTLNVTNASTLTVSNSIAGIGNTLTKIGNGTLVLAAANTHSLTIINGGGLVCANGFAMGTFSARGAGPMIQNGYVDIAGSGNYSPGDGVSNYLFSTVVTFGQQGGATTLLEDSVAGHAGFSVFGISPYLGIVYDGASDPGKATVSAPWYGTGTALVTTRQVQVGTSLNASIGLEFTGVMGQLISADGQSTTIEKTGPGVMKISNTNYFPGLKISDGTLVVGHVNALGSARLMANTVTIVGGQSKLDLNGFSPAIGGLEDGGASDGAVLNNGASMSTLTVGYAANSLLNNSSYSGAIADGASAISIAKVGTNTQTFAGVETYSGPTVINNGALVVNAPGQIGRGTVASTVTVAGGAIGGSGLINAPVVVQSGGTLAPGAGAVGTVTLTVATNLTLTGTSLMNVNKDTATSDLVVLSSGTINYGGTLAVSTNLMTGTTLAVGDSFQLFNATNHTGNFSGIAGSPGPGMAWNFNPATGVLSIVSYVALPSLTGISLSGTNLVITGTNAQVGQQYNVLSSTNLTLPLSQWTVLTTNTFSSEGFSITNTIDLSLPRGFYLIRVPQN